MKKIDTSQPSAAAVDARMNGGYAQSSVPLVAMIVIEGVLRRLDLGELRLEPLLEQDVDAFVDGAVERGVGSRWQRFPFRLAFPWNDPLRRRGLERNGGAGYFFFRKKT